MKKPFCAAIVLLMHVVMSDTGWCVRICGSFPDAPNISGDRLALAAMVLGILALASFISMTIYPPFIFGSIAIQDTAQA